MVANYRCNEIKTESLEKVGENVEALRKESESSLINNFQTRCNSILKIAVGHFEENASQY